MTRPSAKRTLVKLALSLASLVVVLVVLEGVLRLAGWMMVRLAVDRGAAAGKERVILCIGDSFTMGGLSTFDTSYPIQLGGLLRRRHPGTNQRVVNLGRAGSNTAQMLRNLERGIEQNHPEAVVVLGGWNNFRNFYGFRGAGEVSGGVSRAITDVFLDLRVYKMIQMLSERLQGTGPRPLESAPAEGAGAADQIERTRRLTSDSKGHLERGMAFKEAGETERAIACFVESIKANPNDPRGYRQVSKTLRDQELAQQFFLARLKEDPEQAWPCLGMSLVFQDQGRFDEARIWLERTRAVDSEFSDYVERSLHLLDRNRAYTEISTWIRLDLADMKRLCEAHNAQLVIQNYPLGDFAMLARFAAEERLPFVDHLGVFDRFPEAERSKYFLPDDFHPNGKGNAIMAENIYRVLLGMELIEERVPDVD